MLHHLLDIFMKKYSAMNFNALEFANMAHAPSTFNTDSNANDNLILANNILQKLTNGNFFNSIDTNTSIPTTATIGSNNIILPQELLKNSIILNASSFSEEAWQKQIEYDKFMNEIWIGIVLTLIIISMVFCICSCFLYHQFRQWKLNYRQQVQHNQDIESVKFNLDDDDPVPQYTLVSGLPSYEAALDMLKKSPESAHQTCIVVYPSVFNIFTKNEKDDNSIVSSSQTDRKSSLEKSVDHKPSVSSIPSYEEITGLDSNFHILASNINQLTDFTIDSIQIESESSSDEDESEKRLSQEDALLN